MNGLQLFMLVLVVPTMFFATIFGPLYLGMCGSLYFFYHLTDISSYVLKPNYVLALHQSLYQYYIKNSAVLTFNDFMVPVWGPILLGFLLSLFCTYRFIQFLKNAFATD
jgi:hypothetical protein